MPSLGSEYFTAKTAKRLLGYHIRLTRGYTDGGMDSLAELNTGVATGMCEAIMVLKQVLIKPSQMSAPPSVYPRARRAKGTRAGPPGPYICETLGSLKPLG
jgi:hypothetical protein